MSCGSIVALKRAQQIVGQRVVEVVGDGELTAEEPERSLVFRWLSLERAEEFVELLRAPRVARWRM